MRRCTGCGRRGWLGWLGALDFAGGAVVHVNAGVAALVCAFMMGRRRGYGTEPIRAAQPGLDGHGHNAAVFGWLASTRDRPVCPTGVQRWQRGHSRGGSGTGLAWMVKVEWLVRGAPTFTGACSPGMVGGLGSPSSPAASFVQVGSAVWMDRLDCGRSLFLEGATWLKAPAGADDSLDVFGVHVAWAAFAGSIPHGGVCRSADPAGTGATVLNQLIAVAAVAAYSAQPRPGAGADPSADAVAGGCRAGNGRPGYQPASGASALMIHQRQGGVWRTAIGGGNAHLRGVAPPRRAGDHTEWMACSQAYAQTMVAFALEHARTTGRRGRAWPGVWDSGGDKPRHAAPARPRKSDEFGHHQAAEILHLGTLYRRAALSTSRIEQRLGRDPAPAVHYGPAPASRLPGLWLFSSAI